MVFCIDLQLIYRLMRFLAGGLYLVHIQSHSNHRVMPFVDRKLLLNLRTASILVHSRLSFKENQSALTTFFPARASHAMTFSSIFLYGHVNAGYKNGRRSKRLSSVPYTSAW